MKNILISIILGFGSLVANASGLPEEVLIQSETHVAMAPVENRGVYLFQVMSSGAIQVKNNKGDTVVVANLTAPVLAEIKATIDEIKNETLIQPKTPRCADAPVRIIQVRQSEGKNIIVGQEVDCRKFITMDGSAAKVAGIVKNLEDAFDSFFPK